MKPLLARIEKEFSAAVFASSFGAGEMVLTGLIAREFRGIEIFTLGTGRLPRVAHNLIALTTAR